MRKVLQFGILALLTASHVYAAEMANLRNGFSLRHERHEVVGDTTRLYLGADSAAGFVDVATADIESFEPAPSELKSEPPVSKTHASLGSLISDASVRTNIDADFIASVIRVESGNNPRAVSPKGAQGLMQLMPGTANTLGVKDSFDPAENIDGGAQYLRDLLMRYNGDAAKALAAYNAGPQRVQQYGGVPPYQETHAYVARVIRDYNRQKLAKLHQAGKEAGQRPAPEQSAANQGGR